MLCFNRNTASEGIDVNNTNVFMECIICHYWYFLDKGFKFHLDVCNGCHHVLMISMNFSNIVIPIIRGVDYRCIINGISKSKAIFLLKVTDLSEKSGTL